MNSDDYKWLRHLGIAPDEEDFDLQAAWVRYKSANMHIDFSPCQYCGASTGEQHAVYPECPRGTPMLFEE